VPNVPNFLPSKNGLHFNNDFPQVPDITINVAGSVVAIGSADKGLCGGMVYTVRDFFEVGLMIPSVIQAPTSGPLFDYIVARLFDSFNLFVLVGAPQPLDGPMTYLYLMQPTLPDHETWFSQVGLAPHGRAWVMINSEWPKIKGDIDSGHLSPLALVTLKSFDPTQLGENHQVLAYGYDLKGSLLTLHVYDPNFHDDNTVRLSLNLANPQQTTDVSYTHTIYGGDKKIWCFFRPIYSPVTPPRNLAAGPPPTPTPTPAPTIASPLTGDGTDIVIAKVILNGASDQNHVGLRLTAASNITWWKAANLAGQEAWTQDQTKQGAIEVALLDVTAAPVLALKKAKFLGAHTEVQLVVLQNPSLFGGCLIDLLWTKDA
jgi:hypothetical protein